MDIKFNININNISDKDIQNLLIKISNKENIQVKELDEYDCILCEINDIIKSSIQNILPNSNVNISTSIY